MIKAEELIDKMPIHWTESGQLDHWKTYNETLKAVKEAQENALEEAAKVADKFSTLIGSVASTCANEIRALKPD